ncbi:MAG: histidine phosphatase family protein [SAR324 cluster bacterium]|nr:histidine phosphatase family protein [SAR324 cluster bacterium]
MEKTTLIFVRHGETEWNVQGKWQGHLDSPLTEKGLKQTFAMGQRFRNIHCDQLYSSDLSRAYQTAKPISEVTGQHIITSPDLREKNLGIFEGLTNETMKLRYPEEYEQFHKFNPDFAVPGSESIQEFYDRSVATIRNLAEKHLHQTTVMVTHGGFLANLFRFIFNLPIEIPRRFAIPNTSLNTISYSAGFWRMESWGDVAHLEGLSSPV